jgi:hypothetical protein
MSLARWSQCLDLIFIATHIVAFYEYIMQASLAIPILLAFLYDFTQREMSRTRSRELSASRYRRARPWQLVPINWL